jgi:hypothetical protein
MNTSRALVASLFALAITLGASSSNAGQRMPRRTDDAVRVYRQDVETRMQHAHARIAWSLQHRRLRAGERQQIFRDVAIGVSMIRNRVDNYTRDNDVTAQEAADVRALAEAIAAQMNRHYGPIANWNLLA